MSQTTIPLPGNRRSAERLKEMIRVDHAGEYGAVVIYRGQRAVFDKLKGKERLAGLLEEMEDGERHHLETFDNLLLERNVRPTIFAPIWNVAGFALGAGTALLGEKAAMACTVAVEEVIDEHYAAQREKLGADEQELKDTIERFRLEELEHRDIGYENGAEQAPAYPLLTAAIKRGSKLAIWISERV